MQKLLSRVEEPVPEGRKSVFRINCRLIVMTVDNVIYYNFFEYFIKEKSKMVLLYKKSFFTTQSRPGWLRLHGFRGVDHTDASSNCTKLH